MREKLLWFTHDVITHPLTAILTILGLLRLGGFLHTGTEPHPVEERMVKVEPYHPEIAFLHFTLKRVIHMGSIL